MAKSIRIEVLAVSSEGTFRVGSVSRTGRGIYFSPMLPGLDLHMSRHTDGRMHWKDNKFSYLFQEQRRVPIDQVKEFEHILTWGFNVNNVVTRYRPYRGQRVDGLFVVDLRHFEKMQPNFDIHLVNPSFAEKVIRMVSQFEHCQLFLYVKSLPWLALSVSGPMLGD